MPHTDGPAYFPAVATVSLGSYTLLDLYDPKPSGGYEPEPVFSLFQEPRSLLITLGDAYTRYLHGIAERANDCLLYTSPSPRDVEESRMPSSA